ncbi:uncharacterized protein At1g24485-like [Juglans microcarpa x Juglans regia]|uniref:uncharacterized protein At1g24485-like n=1 Tax=Juglans microcarpa x Juglans regia TaxID=2249226 RepID=UPI001B7EF997|nr:uncharacterized protein At1g24485-like [Juglans microcarpa x Juglans regia]
MSTLSSSTSYNLTLLVVVLSAVLLVSKLSFAAFVSIDCGASDSYTDGNQITWEGDNGYVQSGESQQVDQLYSGDHVLSTLRVFPTSGNGNCYTIGDLEDGERVLVRATFFYGNYDGQNSPPSFDLFFDGNQWITVQMSEYPLNTYVYTEAIYVVSGTATSICLAQTQPNQLPFISALELRSLGPNMYSHFGSNDHFLVGLNRATHAKQSVRYRDDPYDRIWEVYGANQYGEIVTSDAATIDVGTAEELPPQAAVRNAYTSTTTTRTYALKTNLLGLGEGNIYIIMYFSEVIRLDPTQKRSIQIYVDGKPYLDPIIPPYGSVLEVHISNLVASPSTKVSVQAASDSTLLPLINAYEVYAVIPYGSNSKDGCQWNVTA